MTLSRGRRTFFLVHPVDFLMVVLHVFVFCGVAIFRLNKRKAHICNLICFLLHMHIHYLFHSLYSIHNFLRTNNTGIWAQRREILLRPFHQSASLNTIAGLSRDN